MLRSNSAVLPTPATALWSPLYAAYYLLLQGRVAYLRIVGKTLMGTLLPENRTEHKHSDIDNPDPLNLAVRSQTNFAENVCLPETPQFIGSWLLGDLVCVESFARRIWIVRQGDTWLWKTHGILWYFGNYRKCVCLAWLFSLGNDDLDILDRYLFCHPLLILVASQWY